MTTEQEIQNLEEQVANLEAMVKNLASGYASTQINRIQMSTDTAAKWEKANRACKPGELIVVIKANGHVAIKMNRETTDALYNDIPVLWDEDVASTLANAMTDAKAAAETAKQSADSATESVTKTEAAAKSINDKTLLTTIDGLIIKLNAQDSGIDITAATKEENTNG